MWRSLPLSQFVLLNSLLLLLLLLLLLNWRVGCRMDRVGYICPSFVHSPLSALCSTNSLSGLLLRQLLVRLSVLRLPAMLTGR